MYDAPCDVRRSFSTIVARHYGEMKRDMLDGDLFLFVGKIMKRAKVLCFDGAAASIRQALSSGQFPAPWKMPKKHALSELALFVEGASAVRQKLSPPVMRKVDLKCNELKRKTCVVDLKLPATRNER